MAFVLAAGAALALARALLILLTGVLPLTIVVLLLVATLVAVRALLVLLARILPLHVVLLLLVPVAVAALVQADLSL